MTVEHAVPEMNETLIGSAGALTGKSPQPLPERRAGSRRSPPQSGVGVGGDQPDPGQAAGDQVGEELVPRGPGLGGGHPHAEDLAVPVAVDAGGQQDDGVDHAAAFADLHRQGVGGHERERPSVIQRPVRNSSTIGSRSAAIRDTWDFDSESMPSVLTSLSIRRVLTPAR